MKKETHLIKFNYAIERNRRKLESLWRETYSLARKVVVSKAKISRLRAVINDYNATLAIVYGEDNYLFLTNFRIKRGIVTDDDAKGLKAEELVEQFIPASEKGNGSRSNRKKRTKKVPTLDFNSDILDLEINFDDPTTRFNIQHAFEVDQQKDDVTYRVVTLSMVPVGKVIFEVWDKHDELTFSVSRSLDDGSLSYIKMIADISAQKGYKSRLFVNDKDVSNGIIFRKHGLSNPRDN